MIPSIPSYRLATRDLSQLAVFIFLVLNSILHRKAVTRVGDKVQRIDPRVLHPDHTFIYYLARDGNDSLEREAVGRVVRDLTQRKGCIALHQEAFGSASCAARGLNDCTLPDASPVRFFDAIPSTLMFQPVMSSGNAALNFTSPFCRCGDVASRV